MGVPSKEKAIRGPCYGSERDVSAHNCSDSESRVKAVLESFPEVRKDTVVRIDQ